MSVLTWLHISDLHLGERNPSWKAVAEALLTDIREHQDPAIAQQAPHAGCVLKPDLVFITGDLANKGKEDEYEYFDAFLEQLWQVTGLNESRTFVIPGNHDVDRTIVDNDALYRTMRDKLSNHSLDEPTLARELHRFWPQREQFFKKHNAFKRATEKLFPIQLQPDPTYYVRSLNLPGLPRIEVVGINTAWMSDQDGEDTKRQLIAGLPQINEICGMLQLGDRPIRITLLHHPFEALHLSDTSVRQLQKLSLVILFGHLHDQRPFYWGEPGFEHVRIPAGALYQGNLFAVHAYNYAQFDVDTGDLTVFLRRATIGPALTYIRDNQTFPEAAPEGWYTWPLWPYRRAVGQPLPKDKLVERTFLSYVDVEYAVHDLVEQIKTKEFKPDVVVGIDRGGAIVGGMLGKYLHIPVTTISVSPKWTISSLASSLDEGLKNVAKRATQFQNINRILLVDDACRSGDTMKDTLDGLKREVSQIEIRMASILNEIKELGPPKPITPQFHVYETQRSDVRMPWDASKTRLDDVSNQ